MKYSIKNISFEVPGNGSFHVESIDVEFNVEEMGQMAQNAQLIIASVKDAVKELVPVVAREIEKADNRRMEHWREKNK